MFWNSGLESPLAAAALLARATQSASTASR